MPFEPKGEIALWRIVYRLFQSGEVGDELTYDQIGTALDMDPEADRNRIQVAARRAAKQLLEHDNRAVEVVTNVGYRVVAAARQIPLAGQQVERATRSLKRGKSLTTHVRMNELSAQEQQIMHTMALGFSQVAEWARQIGQRMEDHEGRLSDIEAELQRLRKEQEPG